MMAFLHFAYSWLKYRWWKFQGYQMMVPDKISQERIRECLVCPHYEEGECLECGCLVQAKVMLASEDCPRGWWPTVKIKDKKPNSRNC